MTVPGTEREVSMFGTVEAFVSEVDALERQIDRVLKASNGPTSDEFLAELPRIRRAVAKLQRGIETLDSSLPVVERSDV
jgi:uncharacterized protein YukE